MSLISLLLAIHPVHSANKECDAKPVQLLVGKPATALNKANARKRSHALLVREGSVDGVMTMDYSPYRLNIIIGKDGKIVQLTCG